MVRLTFIWHDCFIVETQEAYFIFDYWLDSDGSAAGRPAFLGSIDASRPVYVLVSHGHKDHYNPAIFEWESLFPDIRYVVSQDVYRRIRHIISPQSVYSGHKVSQEKVIPLRRGESHDEGRVKVTAFPSTDIGNSWLVETEGLRIFHAGDLNAWIRPDQPEAVNKKMLGDFKACLRDLKSYLASQISSDSSVPAIDFAFFPVDSRIGGDYSSGARMFVREFDVKHFIPMHFDLGDSEERAVRQRDAMNFSLYANPARGSYLSLNSRPASFSFEK